ncbi:MAG: dihydrolipoamide acetyltransferase family protein [Patescibacteria group bacterium]
MAYEFKFPDVGEGIHEGEIVRWRVKVGDNIKEDQPLVEMETAKAIVELPSPRAGTILALNGKEGETINVGAVLIVIGEKGEKPNIFSGPGVIGRIPTDAEGVVLPPRRPEGSTPKSPVQKPEQKFDGSVERVPLKGIRKEIAAHMVKSAFTIPHVTHMDEVDASNLIKMREAKKAEAEKKGIKLTFLPFIIKATTEALKKHPALNASINETGTEIIYKKFYNISVAVDTPEGLMLPVIKNADKKDVFELAKELNELAVACREHKVALADLQGGSFAITNIGSVGGIYATPIVAYGQSANLGVFKIKEKPVAIDGKVEIRPVLTLALSYDHRIVDGAEAARFMNDLIEQM